MLSSQKFRMLIACSLASGPLFGAFLAAALAAEPIRVLMDVSFETPTGSQKMDIFLPELPEPSRRAPCVIWMHGAGGDKAGPREGSVCEDLARAGFIAASINYKPDNTPSPEAVVTCKSAVRFLRASKDNYPVDDRRIGVAGASLGGSLALLTGFTQGDPLFEVKGVYPETSDKVCLVLSLAGPTDWLKLPQAKAPSGLQAAVDQRLKVLSPINHVTSDLPPVLIVHGTGDKGVPHQQAVDLDKRLTKARVLHRFLSLDRVGHSFTLSSANGRPLPGDASSVIITFLHTQFDAVK